MNRYTKLALAMILSISMLNASDKPETKTPSSCPKIELRNNLQTSLSCYENLYRTYHKSDFENNIAFIHYLKVIKDILNDTEELLKEHNSIDKTTKKSIQNLLQEIDFSDSYINKAFEADKRYIIDTLTDTKNYNKTNIDIAYYQRYILPDLLDKIQEVYKEVEDTKTLSELKELDKKYQKQIQDAKKYLIQKYKDIDNMMAILAQKSKKGTKLEPKEKAMFIDVLRFMITGTSKKDKNLNILLKTYYISLHKQRDELLLKLSSDK